MKKIAKTSTIKDFSYNFGGLQGFDDGFELRMYPEDSSDWDAVPCDMARLIDRYKVLSRYVRRLPDDAPVSDLNALAWSLLKPHSREGFVIVFYMGNRRINGDQLVGRLRPAEPVPIAFGVFSRILTEHGLANAPLKDQINLFQTLKKINGGRKFERALQKYDPDFGD
ncbi:hypothetical protein WAE61_03270 [Comamonadaceae bacterium PP-2]